MTMDDVKIARASFQQRLHHHIWSFVCEGGGGGGERGEVMRIGLGARSLIVCEGGGERGGGLGVYVNWNNMFGGGTALEGRQEEFEM